MRLTQLIGNTQNSPPHIIIYNNSIYSHRNGHNRTIIRYTYAYVIPQRRSTPCGPPSISKALRTCPIATSAYSRKQSFNTLILNLSNLPQEILLLVAEHTDQRDRLNLCQASRSLKLAGKPHNYRTVNLSTEGHAMICGQIGDSDGIKPTDIQPSTQSKQERFLQTH